MNKLLLIDHAFHKKTRSADFFIDILKNNFLVDVVYLEPNGSPDVNILNFCLSFDYIVLWQLDFLAPVFLSLGKRVIVIPMYDGSGGMSDLHWIFSKQARFLNFSFYLNEKIRMLGCKTKILRYFPEPVQESALPRFDKLRAFFWQRRPDHGIDYYLIDSLIGSDIDSFHLHDAPDVVGNFSPVIGGDLRYSYTTSKWFENRVDYLNCIASANIYIAPRVAEGIGMAMLEAMAQGKLVIAHDSPTNNEYISSWCNGILFNKDVHRTAISFRAKAESMGRMAWKTVVEGRKKWVASYPEIIEWIKSADAGSRLDINHKKFFIDLWSSYYSSQLDYVNFLCSRIDLLEKLANCSFEQILEIVGEVRRGGLEKKVPSAKPEFSLKDDGLIDLSRIDDWFVGDGWSHAESLGRWVIGYKAELFFCGLQVDKMHSGECSFSASALPIFEDGVRCTIGLNGEIVFSDLILPGLRDYKFAFSLDLIRSSNTLMLAFDKASAIPEDSRIMSVFFSNFVFTTS